ncbi:ribonuclease H-like domain-containing protein [Tanacetum coccineum]
MKTKPDVDTFSIDDLYNNLRVFEQELISTSKSSANAQNVAFVSHNNSSTNKVKSGHIGAYSTYTPTSSNNIQKREVPTGFADEVIYSLFAKQSKDLDLLHEDLEQIDDTGRRVKTDGNKPVGFDKKKLECFKCHKTGHFARECPSKGTNDGKKRDSFYQDQGAGKKEQNQNCLSGLPIAMIAIRMKKFYKKTRTGDVRLMETKPVVQWTNDGMKRDSFYQDQGVGKKEQNQNCLLTMDDGVLNWGEHTVEEEETNHALMEISSNNKVSLCSKTYIDSYNKLKTPCDEQTNQLGKQEAKILAYTLVVKKLEAQVVTFQKQQLSLNKQLTFQANEIYAKMEKA